MLSFVPSNILPYITLGVALISLVMYYVQLNLPSLKLNRLNNTIGMTEDIFTRAKADCGMRDHLLLVEGETRLLRYSCACTLVLICKLNLYIVSSFQHLGSIPIYLRHTAYAG
jgi:hypothetical protein